MHVSTPSRGSGTAACPAAAGVHKIQTRRAHGTPHLESCTPYSDDHSAYRGWQDAGAISATPRTMARTIATPNAMPYSVLSTVFDHCTATIRGKTATSVYPLLMYPAPPCVYKRRRRASLKGVGRLSRHLPLRAHALAPSFRHRYSPRSNPTSSRDLGAFLPLSPRLYPLLQALRV